MYMPRWLEARKWAQQSGLGRALNLLTRVLGISVILTGGDDSTSMCLRTTNDHPVQLKLSMLCVSDCERRHNVGPTAQPILARVLREGGMQPPTDSEMTGKILHH